MRKFLKFIEVESRIEIDEAKEIYEKTSQTVEKLSETIVGIMKVSVNVLTWPPFITTVLNCFAEEDMGPDAFAMPFPMSLIDDFTDVYELVLLHFFTWSYFSICGSFLKINYEISQPVPDVALLVTAAFEGFWAFGSIVFFCEFGHRVFNAFDDLNTVIDEFVWFLFPIEIQKMLPIVMVGCQKTSCIKGFGNVLCIRDTSKRILNGTFSYFMVLRKFEM